MLGAFWPGLALSCLALPCFALFSLPHCTIVASAAAVPYINAEYSFLRHLQCWVAHYQCLALLAIVVTLCNQHMLTIPQLRC